MLLNEELEILLENKKANREKMMAEMDSIGHWPGPKHKGEKDKEFRKRVSEWVEKGDEISKKYKIEIKSQYDPEMVFDTDVGYEVDEIELEA